VEPECCITCIASEYEECTIASRALERVPCISISCLLCVGSDTAAPSLTQKTSYVNHVDRRAVPPLSMRTTYTYRYPLDSKRRGQTASRSMPGFSPGFIGGVAPIVPKVSWPGFSVIVMTGDDRLMTIEVRGVGQSQSVTEGADVKR